MFVPKMSGRAWSAIRDRPRICVSRVARTIAGLAKADDMGETHVAEAIQYRSLDVQGV